MAASAISRILVSRTDSLGDVVLTLPLCSLLKATYPTHHIVFLCRDYARPVVEACPSVDTVLSYDELAALAPATRTHRLGALGLEAVVHVFPRKDVAHWAQQARIPVRIGTRSRLYHWTTCNRRPALHRKNSPLHEAQLNVLLAASLLPGLPQPVPLVTLAQNLRLIPRVPLPVAIAQEVAATQRPLVVLHPKSAGSAREWPAENYVALAHRLHQYGYQTVITGTTAEADRLGPHRQALHQANALDLMGRLTLAELIALLAQARALVACSTGPLHIAAGLGIRAVGLYPPIRPMHAGRWAPLGANVRVLERPGPCNACRKSPQSCACIAALMVNDVAQAIG